MGLIASIAHGFKHCRKRASGYHPLYEGSLPHSRRTTWAQVQLDSERSASETTRLEHFPSFPPMGTQLGLSTHNYASGSARNSSRVDRSAFIMYPTDILPGDIFTKTITKTVRRKLVDLIQACASWRSKPEHYRVILERIMFDLFFEYQYKLEGRYQLK